MLLSNKVAIVTGGSRGIGKAIVEEFSKEGAKVAFNYLKSEEEAYKIKNIIEADGREIAVFKVDVRDFDGMKEMVQKVKERFGKLDILVNNVGITRDKTLMLMQKEDWDDVIDINLSGVFNLTRAVIVTFLTQKSGTILNISSVSGIMGLPRQVNYSASKAGILGFTKSLAKEVGPYNVRVNALAPGYIKTDMTGKLKGNVFEKIISTIPLSRIGMPGEIAKAAVFMVSEKSSYITGQVIPIDGGLLM